MTVDRKKVIQEAAAKKQIKNTKQILTLAETENLLVKNPIQKFRCGGDETDILPLEFYEVNLLWRKDISTQRLAEVRDIFIFQCFTGFAFQDVYGLTEDHLVRVGIKGEQWLIKERGKTNVTEMVPVMPIVEEIIKKDKSHPCRMVQGRLLPVNSNSRFNGYLKEIAVIAGLNRELNTGMRRLEKIKSVRLGRKLGTLRSLMMGNYCKLLSCKKDHAKIKTTLNIVHKKRVFIYCI